MNDFKTITGYNPGIIGRIAELHARYYSEQWGFGQFFEIKVAKEISDFIENYDETKDRIWSVSVNNTIEGSITIDGSSETDNTAHLRWFIISDTLRGKGTGNHLMQNAMSFCKEKGYEKVYLWTFQGLESARHLYEKYSFTLQEERSGKQWGRVVTEQCFVTTLDRINNI